MHFRAAKRDPSIKRIPEGFGGRLINETARRAGAKPFRNAFYRISLAALKCILRPPALTTLGVKWR